MKQREADLDTLQEILEGSVKALQQRQDEMRWVLQCVCVCVLVCCCCVCVYDVPRI